MSKNHEHSHDDHSHHHEEVPDHKEHGHTHGLVDRSILRSKAGLKATSLSLLVFFITAGIQVFINLSVNSVALWSEAIHNFGDALTAIPLGLAFYFRSEKAEKYAGYAIVTVIFLTAGIILFETLKRFIDPQTPTHLLALAFSGVVGLIGNEIVAYIRTSTGKRINSPALIADGKHAHVDGLVSLGIILSAFLVWIGVPYADPVVGLLITILVLRTTYEAFVTIKNTKIHQDEVGQ